MEKKRKTLLLLLLLAAIMLFCMPNVSCAVSDDNLQGHSTKSEVIKGPNRRLLTVDCGARCNMRCSAHSRPKVCNRACGTCCLRCKCVPPGTYGNREVCGKCYTDMVTHGNKPKCP